MALNDSTGSDFFDPGQAPTAPTPWWEGPRPAGYPEWQPWPPPLPPGGHYGDIPGQVIADPSNPNNPSVPLTGPVTPPTPAPPPPGPSAPPPPGAPPPATGNTGGPLPGAPTFTAPTYTPPPAMQAPPAFSYGNFVAPDPNDLNKDPAYQYDLKTQQEAIQHSAAARGVLNTGGTIYDLLSNAQDIASTGFHDLWGRRKAEYDTNRGNAFDTWKANYGVGKDVYDTNTQTQYTDPFKYGYQGAQDTYNSRQHNFDLGTQYSWYGKLFDFQKDQDAFDRKYRLLQYA